MPDRFSTRKIRHHLLNGRHCPVLPPLYCEVRSAWTCAFTAVELFEVRCPSWSHVTQLSPQSPVQWVQPSPKSRFIIGFPTWVIILNNSKFSLVNITIFVDESPQHRGFPSQFFRDLEHWWSRIYLLVKNTSTFWYHFFWWSFFQHLFFGWNAPPSSGETVEPALPILEIPSQQKSRISTHPADLVLIHSIPKNMPMKFH